MKTAERSAIHRMYIVLSVVFCFLSALFFQVYRLSHIAGSGFEATEQRNAVYSTLFADCIEELSDTFRSYFNSADGEAPACPSAYTEENSNFSFTARDSAGHVILRNYTAADVLYSETCGITVECAAADAGGVLREEKVTVMCAVRSDLRADDCFRRAARLMQAADSAYRFSWMPAILFGVLAILLAVFSVRDVLREAGRRRVPQTWITVVPPDLYLVCVLPALLLCYRLFPNSGTELEMLHGFIRSGGGIQRFLYTPLCVWGVFSIVFLFLLLLLFSLCRGGWRYVVACKRFEDVPFTHKTIVYFICMQAVKLLSIALYLSAHTRAVLLFLLLEKAVTLPVLYRSFREIRTIIAKTSDYVTGDLSEPMLPDSYYKSFAAHAQDIHTITERISFSADEYIKGSRFKAELITNLSHDIKTPLTSIINYAQLLGNPQLPPEEKQHCLEVLDRHSQRLNKLVEDLMEVSDAQSGNIKVNLTQVDLCTLIPQAAAGFEERLQKRALSLGITVPDTPVLVTADARLLWRVADNLMNNICKYAREGTQVQIAVVVRDKVAAAVFRNRSANALELSGEQLMEQFVRGDSARHTDGSGLGLSIARSLMQLQGGRLHLNTENDLFTAQMLLRLSENRQPEK